MTKSLALTDAKIKAAHNVKTKQLTDGRGLYLKLAAPPHAHHSWRFDFKSPADGKRKTLYLGHYPDVSLKDARELAHEARAQIAKGVCPVAQRETAKEGQKATQERAERKAKGQADPGSFKALATEFYDARFSAEPRPNFRNSWGAGHARKWLSLMQRFAYPAFGDVQAADITAEQVLMVVQAAERAGKTPTAVNLRVYIGQVFKLAKVKRLCIINPAEDLRGVVTTRAISKPHAAQVTAAGAAHVITTIDAHEHEMHRECLQLLALTWQRPGNVRAMEWAHVDLDAGLWVIPSANMKRRVQDKEKGDAHVVPLPTQAVELLRRRLAKAEPGARFVFAAKRADGKCLSHTSISRAMADMGLSDLHKPHGFRAMARTMLREVHKLPADMLEAHLAHSNGLATGVSYDRATYLGERVDAVQVWADYLDQLRGGNVKHLRAA
jgi:integrase